MAYTELATAEPQVFLSFYTISGMQESACWCQERRVLITLDTITNMGAIFNCYFIINHMAHDTILEQPF